MVFSSKFQIKDNNVFYPALSRRKKIKGKWRLGRGHRLIFDFERSVEGRKQLTLAGNFSFSQGSLLFCADKTSAYLLNNRSFKLKGIFGLNAEQKLVFSLRKHASGQLVFSSRWQTNKNNQIVYTYRSKNQNHSFVLRGRWQAEKGSFLYFLEGRNNSYLKIRSRFRTAPLVIKKDRLEFYLGAGQSFTLKKKEKRFTLWGRAKLYKNRLYFEISGGNRFYFELNRSFARRSRVKVGLRSSRLRKRSFLLELERKLGENIVFLKGKKNRRSWGIYGGVKLKF